MSGTPTQSANYTTLSELPRQALNPAYALARLGLRVVSLLTLLLALVIVFNQTWFRIPSILSEHPLLWFTLTASIGVLIISLGWLADKRKYYAVCEHDIHFSSGLWVSRVISQPIGRVQHVEVTQGPLERWLDLARLHIYSAGSGWQSFTVPGLPSDTAHQLRTQISQQADQISSAEVQGNQ